VVPQEPEPPTQAASPAEYEATCTHHRPVRLSWAKLLKRVFEIDLEHCPNCGGELKIIAAILEQPVIEKIVTHLGFQARAKPFDSALLAELVTVVLRRDFDVIAFDDDNLQFAGQGCAAYDLEVEFDGLKFQAVVTKMLAVFELGATVSLRALKPC